MQLSRNDLAQLDEAYLAGLAEGALRGLSAKLLDDLKEAGTGWIRTREQLAPAEQSGAVGTEGRCMGVGRLAMTSSADAAEGDLEPKPAPR